jgi:hypothetical protein
VLQTFVKEKGKLVYDWLLFSTVTFFPLLSIFQLPNSSEEDRQLGNPPQKTSPSPFPPTNHPHANPLTAQDGQYHVWAL